MRTVLISGAAQHTSIVRKYVIFDAADRFVPKIFFMSLSFEFIIGSIVCNIAANVMFGSLLAEEILVSIFNIVCVCWPPEGQALPSDTFDSQEDWYQLSSQVLEVLLESS